MSGSAPSAPAAESGSQRLTAHGVLGGVALAAVMGFVIVRAAVEDRTPLRNLEVHGLWFQTTKVDPGQTVTQELAWTADRDVYVVGWSPTVLPHASGDHTVELTLSDGETRIFVLAERGSPPGDAEAGHAADLPEGTGYLVRAGRALTLRLRMANQGNGELRAERPGALIRCVPAA